MNDPNQYGAENLPPKMQIALDNFYDAGTTLINDNISKLRKDPPPVIYHYTTDVGLRGILESGMLWLTDIFALNDPSELHHGVQLATDILDNKAMNEPAEYRLFANNFKTVLKHCVEELPHFFVCSFSKNGNDLGQWRAYADNGRGYSLGFDTRPVQTFFENTRPVTSGGETFPVIYSDAQLGEIHKQLIDNTLPLTSLPCGENSSLKVSERYLPTLHVRHAFLAIYAALHFKHEAYRNEDEYRFLEMHPACVQPEVKYRARSYGLIKYREFDWKSAGLGVLKEIVIGPAANFEKSKRFAKDCLREAGIDLADDAITQSPIPYRPT